MALKKILYPLDRTGVASTNRIAGELHTTGVDRYRAFTLGFAPFFADSVVIKEVGKSTPLQRGKDKDYELVYFYPELSKLCAGKEIAGVVVICNQNLGTEYEVSYNTIGAHYAASSSVIASAIAALELDNRNIYWKDVLDTPELWQPAPHPHDMGDVYGLEWLLDMLASIREALMIGDNAVHTEIINRINSAITNLTVMWNNHVSQTGNVHNLTAAQIGAYTAAQIDTIVQALNKRIDDLSPTFANISASLANLQQQINSLSGAMSAWDTELENLTADYDRLVRQLADTNTSLSVVNDSLVSINGAIDTLRNKDNQLQLQIDNLNTSLGEYSTAMLQLEMRIVSLETRMSAAEANVVTLANQVYGLNQRFGSYIPTSYLPPTGGSSGQFYNKLVMNYGGGVQVGDSMYWHCTANPAPDFSQRLQYNGTVGGYQLVTSGYYNCMDVFIRSDIRDKDDVRALEPFEADKILRQFKNGIRYTMKGEHVTTAGMSAQVVNKYFAEGVSEVVVSEATEDKEEVRRLTLRQGALVGLLVSGYNFQSRQLAEMAKAIKTLQKDVAGLKSK